MIVVTGANGQLASEFKELLGDKALFLGRDQLDLGNLQNLANFLNTTRITTLINAAAYTQVDKAESEQELANVINHFAPSLMAEFAAKKKFKFLHFSTDYVFDGNSLQSYREEDQTNPLNEYGKTKLMGEKAIAERCPEAAIIRTSWVYSKYGKNFIKTILKASSEKDELRIVSDQIGSLTSAKSLAEASLKAIERDLAGVYHFSGEGVSSWYDVAVFLKKISGFKTEIKPITTSQFPTPAKRPQFSLLDKKKIKNDLDIEISSWMDELTKIYKDNIE